MLTILIIFLLTNVFGLSNKNINVSLGKHDYDYDDDYDEYYRDFVDFWNGGAWNKVAVILAGLIFISIIICLCVCCCKCCCGSSSSSSYRNNVQEIIVIDTATDQAIQLTPQDLKSGRVQIIRNNQPSPRSYRSPNPMPVPMPVQQYPTNVIAYPVYYPPVQYYDQNPDRIPPLVYVDNNLPSNLPPIGPITSNNNNASNKNFPVQNPEPQPGVEPSQNPYNYEYNNYSSIRGPN